MNQSSSFIPYPFILLERNQLGGTEADFEVIRLRKPLNDRLRECDLVLDGLFGKHNLYP